MALMPQQPLHPCLLPVSSRFSSLSLVTNPYDCRLGDAGAEVRMVGHSGQPVGDILCQTDFSALVQAQGAAAAVSAADLSLQALKATLQWGHLAPTAPDTLACYPLTDDDPFVMPALNSKESSSSSTTDNNDTPHILFAGNQPGFASELVEGINYRTLLVCVPSFRETGTAVLVNTRTLKASTVSFQLNGGPETDMDTGAAIDVA